MKTTKDIGDKGEQLAIDYLLKKGFSIEVTNFRYRRGEIDIIAVKKDVLYFVEVKYRKSTYFGNPEEFVDAKKLNLMRTVAEFYIERVDWKGDIQFDIIAIVANQIDHFEDVLI